ncbi:MAG TPA: hypothetical protein VHL53_00565 [Acidimicrobiia bacterium]|nr:hypothetical protein [Acidimicrobiia bacterium]
MPEDDEHHGGPDADDFIERLRETISRSDAKTLAVDDLPSGRASTGSSIDRLRDERRRLTPIVNQAPRAPFDALAALELDQQQAAANVARARQERAAAEAALERLGGHRRLTRRRDRQQAKERLDRASLAENWAENTIGRIGDRRKSLDAELAEWKAWTAEHGHQASRLRHVDSLLAEHRRRHQPEPGQQIGNVRDAGRDLGMDLGL